jgi:hypothetical protein
MQRKASTRQSGPLQVGNRHSYGRAMLSAPVGMLLLVDFHICSLTLTCGLFAGEVSTCTTPVVGVKRPKCISNSITRSAIIFSKERAAQQHVLGLQEGIHIHVMIVMKGLWLNILIAKDIGVRINRAHIFCH